MSRGFTRLLTVFLILMICLCSCESQGIAEPDDGIVVCTWNVQNLFDCTDDGTEYEEYLQSSGWSSDAYSSRLSDIGKVVSYLPRKKDMILVLNEVENASVVEDILRQREFSDRGMYWFACAGEEGGAIMTSVVSSIPISTALVHDVDDGLRPVLEVGFDTEKGWIFVLAVHAKSNIGDAQENAESRLKTGKVLKTIAQNLENTHPGCLILVCGDINEECYDDNVMGRSATTECPLPVSGSFVQRRWYCQWLDSSVDCFPGGSYCYNDVWRCYDNVLVSYSGRDGAGLEMTDCGVVFSGVLKTSDGKVNAWNRKLLKGVSDHLPVWISIL